MVLLAQASLILGRDVLLLLELVVTMGKCATVTKAALASDLPVSAHLNNEKGIRIF